MTMITSYNCREGTRKLSFPYRCKLIKPHYKCSSGNPPRERATTNLGLFGITVNNLWHIPRKTPRPTTATAADPPKSLNGGRTQTGVEPKQG